MENIKVNYIKLKKELKELQKILEKQKKVYNNIRNKRIKIEENISILSKKIRELKSSEKNLYDKFYSKNISKFYKVLLFIGLLVLSCIGIAIYFNNFILMLIILPSVFISSIFVNIIEKKVIKNINKKYEETKEYKKINAEIKKEKAKKEKYQKELDSGIGELVSENKKLEEIKELISNKINEITVFNSNSMEQLFEDKKANVETSKKLNKKPNFK